MKIYLITMVLMLFGCQTLFLKKIIKINGLKFQVIIGKGNLDIKVPENLDEIENAFQI